MVRKAVKKIAVIIPCYNEAAGIEQVIKKIPRQKNLDVTFRCTVFVVDNNSTDDTAKIAAGAGAVVIYEPKKGKGHALRAGFKAVPDDYDYVVMLDGDDTYSPDEIMRLVEPLYNNFSEVVIGSRLGGNIKSSAMSTFNRLGNWLFTNGVRNIYRANVTDVLTGYFAWKKTALDRLYPHLKSDGFAIEMEMVTKMARLGMAMTSVPVSYHPRAGESNLHPLRDGARILRMFAKSLWWRPPKDTASRPKKIVFATDSIYPYFKGGKEKRLFEISRHLATMGYEVHIYTMHWWRDIDASKHRMEHGVHLHAICNYYEMYKNDRRTIKEGVMFGLACLKLFRVSFDVLDVDHMPFFPVISTWIVCKLRRKKFYGTWHEALSLQDWKDYMGAKGVLASAIERFTIRLPHAITAASQHTKEQLASVHGRAERVGLVASGIDASLIANTPPADIRCDVLYVGRFVKDKNVSKLISAIHILAQQTPDIRCVIVGHGVELRRLQDQAQRLGIQQNIQFLPPLAEAAEIYAYMKAARVFCLPSIREGFSIVTLEALACGTPVVTTDSPANAAQRMVKQGESGSIVDCSPKHLARAMGEWLEHSQKPELPLKVAEYDWQVLAKQQVELYSI